MGVPLTFLIRERGDFGLELGVSIDLEVHVCCTEAADGCPCGISSHCYCEAFLLVACKR